MRAFDTLYGIDGQPLLVPDAGVELTENDIDSEAAGRDAAGYMHRHLLRSGIRTWAFTYSFLTAEELAYLRSLFAGKASFVFGCEDGEVTAYCTKREVTLYDRARGLYKGMKFTVVEC